MKVEISYLDGIVKVAKIYPETAIEKFFFKFFAKNMRRDEEPDIRTMKFRTFYWYDRKGRKL